MKPRKHQSEQCSSDWNSMTDTKHRLCGNNLHDGSNSLQGIHGSPGSHRGLDGLVRARQPVAEGCRAALLSLCEVLGRHLPEALECVGSVQHIGHLRCESLVKRAHTKVMKSAPGGELHACKASLGAVRDQYLLGTAKLTLELLGATLHSRQFTVDVCCRACMVCWSSAARSRTGRLRVRKGRRGCSRRSRLVPCCEPCGLRSKQCIPVLRPSRLSEAMLKTPAAWMQQKGRGRGLLQAPHCSWQQHAQPVSNVRQKSGTKPVGSGSILLLRKVLQIASSKQPSPAHPCPSCRSHVRPAAGGDDSSHKAHLTILTGHLGHLWHRARELSEVLVKGWGDDGCSMAAQLSANLRMEVKQCPHSCAPQGSREAADSHRAFLPKERVPASSGQVCSPQQLVCCRPFHSSCAALSPSCSGDLKAASTRPE